MRGWGFTVRVIVIIVDVIVGQTQVSLITLIMSVAFVYDIVDVSSCLSNNYCALIKSGRPI